MNDVKGLNQEMRVQRIGLAYNNFVQNAGSIQSAGTMGAFLCVILLAVNQAINYIVVGKTIAS